MEGMHKGSTSNRSNGKKLMISKNESLLGKLVRVRSLNTAAFYGVVSKAWSTRAPKKIKFLGDFVFLFVFRNVQHKIEILNSGPWCFMESLLVLKDWPASGKIADLDFTKSMFWVQAHNLPPVYRTIENAQLVADLFCKFLECSDEDLNVSYWDGFMRLKVELDVTAPLTRGFIMGAYGMKPLWIQFKYERLPTFCFYCGIMGHSKYECNNVHYCHGNERYGKELRAVQPSTFALGKNLSMRSRWDYIALYSAHLGQTTSPDVYEPNPIEEPQPLMSVNVVNLNETTQSFVQPFLRYDVPVELINALSNPEKVAKSLKLPRPAELELPPLPQDPEVPANPTEEECEYIARNAWTPEEHEEYRKEMDAIPDDFKNDHEVVAVRKFYLAVERLVRRFRNDLNPADKAWFNKARNYLKVIVQNNAYPIEEGVWDIDIAPLMERKLLMKAILIDSEEEE